MCREICRARRLYGFVMQNLEICLPASDPGVKRQFRMGSGREASIARFQKSFCNGIFVKTNKNAQPPTANIKALR